MDVLQVEWGCCAAVCDLGNCGLFEETQIPLGLHQKGHQASQTVPTQTCRTTHCGEPL